MGSLVGMLRGAIVLFIGLLALAAVGAPTAQASSAHAAGGLATTGQPAPALAAVLAGAMMFASCSPAFRRTRS